MLLLDDENKLVLSPVLAKGLGLNEAHFLQQVHYWLRKNIGSPRHLKGGRTWCWNTYADWQQQLPFMSLRTVQRVIASLKKSGVLLTGCFNRMPGDRTRWYTIDYDHPAILAGGHKANLAGPIPETTKTPETTKAKSSAEPVPTAQAQQEQDKPAQGQPGQINPKVKGKIKGNPVPVGSLTPPPLAPPPSPEESSAVTTAQVITKHAPVNPGKLKAPKAVKVLALGVLWKDKGEATYPEMGGVHLSAVDAQKLKLIYRKLGVDAREVVAWAIEHWLYFTSMVNAQRGESGAPYRPHPGYLLAHAGIADDLRRQQALQLAEVTEMAEQASLPRPVPKPVDKQESKEEGLARRRRQWKIVYPDSHYPPHLDPDNACASTTCACSTSTTTSV